MDGFKGALIKVRRLDRHPYPPNPWWDGLVVGIWPISYVDAITRALRLCGEFTPVAVRGPWFEQPPGLGRVAVWVLELVEPQTDLPVAAVFYDRAVLLAGFFEALRLLLLKGQRAAEPPRVLWLN
jgi:hypothetical protein